MPFLELPSTSLLLSIEKSFPKGLLVDFSGGRLWSAQTPRPSANPPRSNHTKTKQESESYRSRRSQRLLRSKENHCKTNPLTSSPANAIKLRSDCDLRDCITGSGVPTCTFSLAHLSARVAGSRSPLVPINNGSCINI